MTTLIDPRRRTCWVRLAVRMFLAAVLSLIIAALSSYYYFSEPHRLAAITAELLHQLTGAQVHIDRAAVTFGGEIDLQGVYLSVPGLDGPAAELFSAQRTTLKVDPLAALRGKIVAKEMVFIRPVLSLTQVRDGEFNYERLRLLKTESPHQAVRLPQVVIRQGQLRYGDVHEGQYESFALDVLGHLTPDPVTPSRYFFELHQYQGGAPAAAEDASQAGGATMRGSFDLDRLEVTAKVSDFALIDPHRTALPRQIRQRWEMFEPAGTMPNARFEYDPRTGIRVELKVEGVAITIPQLSTSDYRCRMTDVSGTLRFDADKVQVSDLVGQIEGIAYRINGDILGYSPDAPFRLAMETRPFRIPEKPRYMVAMPLAVQNIFHMLRPVGWMRVSLSSERGAPGGEVDYRGTAKIISGRDVLAEIIGFAPKSQWNKRSLGFEPDSPELISHGAYFKFPYDLTNVRGLITFNKKAIEVHNLTGDTPGGGSATITGTIGPPSPDPAVDLVITAVNIGFDDALRHALGERQREAMDLFFNFKAEQSLRSRGFFVSRSQRAADEAKLAQLHVAARDAGADAALKAELERHIAEVSQELRKPVFELGGRGNALVRVKQAAGPSQPFDIHVTLDLAAANVIFRYVPYPLVVRSGRLVITDRDVTFDSVMAEGLHGGVMGVSGNVNLGPDGHGPITPEIVLSVQKAPIDELLLTTVPDPQDKWLRMLHLTGMFNAEGNLYRGDKGIDAAVKITPIGVTASPGGGRFTLTDIEADLLMSLQGLKVARVVGRHGAGRIEVAGEADWSDAHNPTLKFNAKAAGMRFEDPVVDLLAPAVESPQELRGFWDTHQPRGTFAATVDYERASRGEPRFKLVIEPAALSFAHGGGRVSLSPTSGRFVIDRQKIELDQFAGQFDGGKLAATGTIVMEPHIQAEVSLTLDGTHIGPEVRRAMPAFVSEALEKTHFSGRYHIEVPRLKVDTQAKSGDWVSVQATIDLSEASAQLGLALSDFEGRIGVDAQVDAATNRGRYRLDVSGKSLRVAGRRVTDFAMKMHTDTDGRTLLAPVLRGEYYGGAMEGNMGVGLDDGTFKLQMALSNVDLERMSVDTADAPPLDPKLSRGVMSQAMSGLMSLSLAVDGSWRDQQMVRGRGDMVVREAKLEGVPLAMGLLRVAHLQLPGSNAFNTAAVSYYVRDDQVVFERIDLDGPSMRLAGNGNMRYSTGKLDLTLTTANPAGLKLGPVTTLIDGLRNQFVTLRVTGTVDKPDVRVKQFNGISEAWRDVFGDKPNQ